TRPASARRASPGRAHRPNRDPSRAPRARRAQRPRAGQGNRRLAELATDGPYSRCPLMQVLESGEIVLAATDLTNYLACPHLTQQQLAIARGERPRPRPADDPHAELIRRRGEQHEREQLERLVAQCGGSYVDLSGLEHPQTRKGLEHAAA